MHEIWIAVRWSDRQGDPVRAHALWHLNQSDVIEAVSHWKDQSDDLTDTYISTFEVDCQAVHCPVSQPS